MPCDNFLHVSCTDPYIAPLRGREDTQTLWLEAPNRVVAAWVNNHLPLIESALRPHTELPVRVCIG